MRKIVVLDVRDILRKKGEPFQLIMQTVESLGSHHVLQLHATFEPVPLFRVLGQQGFQHMTRQLANDHYVVQFTREKTEIPHWYLDNRGLDPPQPMMNTLAFLDGEPRISEGTCKLEVWNDRVPMFLLPELEARGLTYDIIEEDGYVRVVISK